MGEEVGAEEQHRLDVLLFFRREVAGVGDRVVRQQQ